MLYYLFGIRGVFLQFLISWFHQKPKLFSKEGIWDKSGIGPIHDLLINMFWMRKRNSSLRRFIYAPDRKKLMIIVFGGIYFYVYLLILELLIIQNKT